MSKIFVKVVAIGGPFDGKHETHVNDGIPTVQSDFASTAYYLTQCGEVGRRFTTVSPYAIARLDSGTAKTGEELGTYHKYEVVDSVRVYDELSLVLQYISDNSEDL